MEASEGDKGTISKRLVPRAASVHGRMDRIVPHSQRNLC